MLNLNKIVVSSLLICTFFCGCHTDSLSDVDLPIPDVDESVESTEPNTLKVANSEADVSPAVTQFRLPDINTPANDVCRQFIDLLNQGDSETFELLLTPAALNVCTKLQFSLPPLGEPNSEVKISAPSFSTIREKLCFVDCEIRDSESTNVSLMLRSGKNGWRIAGMMVDGEQPDSKNLLSFESLTDVSQIRDSLNITATSN